MTGHFFVFLTGGSNISYKGFAWGILFLRQAPSRPGNVVSLPSSCGQIKGLNSEHVESVYAFR
jgi:hypothetical protein